MNAQVECEINALEECIKYTLNEFKIHALYE